jgi:uncharacterized membrane protein YhhN
MTLLILSIVFAIAHWFSIYKKSRIGILVTKPLVMIFLIAWMLVSIPNVLYRIPSLNLLPLWFLMGLCFGLVGDIFLMWPERYFLPGLIAFLVNQVFYLIGFGTYFFTTGNSGLQSGLYGIVLLILLATVYSLFRGMDKNGMTRMKMPIGIYAVIISLMVVAAFETFFFQWPLLTSGFVALGASLFYISDIMNAWTRFVAPISHDRIKIMTTYHIAQICITVGIVLAATTIA